MSFEISSDRDRELEAEIELDELAGNAELFDESDDGSGDLA